MTDEYLAGFFDGEGSIFPNKRGNHNITISQKSRGVLDEIQAYTGYGSVRLGHQDSMVYRYGVYNRKGVLDFLIRIAPHVIVKRDKVEVALKEVRRRSRVESIQNQDVP